MRGLVLLDIVEQAVQDPERNPLAGSDAIEVLTKLKSHVEKTLSIMQEMNRTTSKEEGAAYLHGEEELRQMAHEVVRLWAEDCKEVGEASGNHGSGEPGVLHRSSHDVRHLFIGGPTRTETGIA